MKKLIIILLLVLTPYLVHADGIGGGGIFGGGGGVGKQNPAVFFTSNTSYTVPYTGKYRLSAVGAGASGGAIFQTTAGGAASGGGGGAFSETEINLVVGDVLTIVTGVGGAVASSSVSTTGVDGNSGTATTIVCAARGLNMSAGFGVKGLWTITNTASVAGGAGGTATGGTLNYAGGAGGAAEHLTNGTTAGGGGAAGSPFGIGAAGGSVDGAAAILGAGGGGGIIYAGASVTTAVLGGGGGTGGLGIAAVGGVSRLNQGAFSADGINRTAGFDSLIDPFRGQTSYGAAGSATLATAMLVGPGGGGGATSTTAAASDVLKSLGGTGGSIKAAVIRGYAAGYGGGTGGCVSSITGPATSGVGGKGLVAVERIE